MISKRDVLKLTAGAAASALSPAGFVPVLAKEGESLKALARAKGVRFGSAMAARQIADKRYCNLVVQDCDVIVAENEHKWYSIHPQPDKWNFEPADALVDFAKANNIGMRGHTLLWHHPRWLPEWVMKLEFSSGAEAEAKLGDYITRVAERYSPFLYSWDVVNETIDDKTGELRETPFSKAMGPEVIDFCFHKAKEAAPNATLAYNDYMSWESGNENHRAGILKLLERLLNKGAPLHALGIQSHSNYDMPNEFTPAKQRVWRAFVDEVVGMGLEIYLTEFDVNDTRLGPDIEMRDRLIASYAKDYLDLMLSYPQTKDLLAWGLVDKDSWLQSFLPRTDGVEKRPTLFDSNYQPKAIRGAVADALRNAPPR